MGVRIAGVIILATLFSYFHMLRTVRAETLAQMERYALERSQREQAIFVLAEDNHAVIKKAFEARFRAWSQVDPNPRFDSLFAPRADGTIRNKPQGFDGTTMPGVFVPPGVTTDADFRRRLLAAYEVVSQYGPAFHVRFMDTGVILPEGAVVGYWPEGPNYFMDLEPGFSLKGFEYFTLALPENNPRRESVWTGAFEDPPSQTWMVTVATPLDLDGRHVATLSHDVLLNELMSRISDQHLSGTYNILFRDDGQLIVHPELKLKSGAQPYNILTDTRRPEEVFARGGTAEQRAHLRGIFERVKSGEPGQIIQALPEYAEYIAVAPLRGPGWHLVTVVPERVVSRPALQAARYVMLFGILALLVELAIMYWVLQQQLTRPLLAFTQATEQVATGDFKVGLVSSREDELGRLARSFQLMADELQRREEALRQANTGLEQRVQERTRELQAKNEELDRAMRQLRDTQKQLVAQEKLASLGSLTAGIAHELKNPLNFVNNFAKLSADLADELTASLESQRPRMDPTVSADVDEVLSDLRRNMSKIWEHGGRANQIINGMLMHSRESSGTKEPADLNEVVKEGILLAYHGSRARAPGFELDLQTDYDPQVSRVEMVALEIIRVIVNVVDNACYSMQQKKRALGDAFSPRLDVRTRSLGDRVEVRIRDNGTGIPNSLVGKVFDPFLTTKPAGEGTGLGLSISHDIIVGYHQGNIRVESVDGEFAEMIIELPRHAA